MSACIGWWKKPGHLPARYDFEYKRGGTCNLFVFFQPLKGWRKIKVTERRTKMDFAHCMRELVDDHFPLAEMIRFVADNLNIHTPAALYEIFSAGRNPEDTEEARISSHS
jgi:hypothetical protein